MKEEAQLLGAQQHDGTSAKRAFLAAGLDLIEDMVNAPAVPLGKSVEPMVRELAVDFREQLRRLCHDVMNCQKVECIAHFTHPTVKLLLLRARQGCLGAAACAAKLRVTQRRGLGHRVTRPARC
jgi:hypothetical protein